MYDNVQHAVNGELPADVVKRHEFLQDGPGTVKVKVMSAPKHEAPEPVEGVETK